MTMLSADTKSEAFRRSLDITHTLLTARKKRNARIVFLEDDNTQTELILT
jgi:hypothetical protein